MNVDCPPFLGISLCSGVGMLDEAVALAFPGARTACFVEWESYAQACLLARMEEASLEPAPIWGDSLESFPAEQFAGRISWIAAGFPCQPHSAAGKRKGVEDERWIWDAIADIIRRVGPRFVFLENVRGLLSSSGGSAFGTVLRDLARLGFDVQWTVLRASEVGAAHQRARVFILAHRPGERLGEAGSDHGQSACGLAGSGATVADTTGSRCHRAGLGTGAGRQRGLRLSGEGCADVADGESKRRGQGQPESGGITRGCDVARGGVPLADTERGFVSGPGRGSEGRNGTGPTGPNVLGEPEGLDGRTRCNQRIASGSAESESADRLVANARGAGCEGGELPGACDRGRFGPHAHGPVAELCGPFIFAPGPQSEHWGSIIAHAPHLAPAVEPGLRVLVDGVAYLVDESRADALRCAGNGVVALQAAAAFSVLAQRLGTLTPRRD